MMLLKNCFKITLLFLLLVIFSQRSAASLVERKCGGTTFQVKILNGSDLFERRFEIFYQKNGQKKIFYKSEPGIDLIAACIKNTHGKDLMLFQEFCGGNGCPEDLYGIFDPSIEKMLIKPSDWPKGNSKQVQQLIGCSLPSLVEDKRSFCCYEGQY